MIKKYFESVSQRLNHLLEQEQENLEKAAKIVSEKIRQEGVVYVFGCGHSHIFGEELFYRAGGLAAVYPILHEPLMLHEGAVRSSQIERKNDYAKEFITDYAITENDALIVISTSGINPVPVDVAQYAKDKGAEVIVITSKAYSSSRDSRHDEGLKLYEIGDVVIDNKIPAGDTSLELEGVATAFGSQSSVMGVTIVQSIMAGAVEDMVANSYDPPIFLSGNMPDSDDHNNQLVEKYADRIPILKKGLDS